jgi:3-deoxy-7-phosphoheptulonate synthase
MANVEPLATPAELRAEIRASPAAVATTRRASETIRRVLAGEDDRLVVITGPCSVHDPRAALVYAERLAGLAKDVANEVLVVMRVYLEKPRTRLGWKGLLSDPQLDGSHDVNRGLWISRRLMAEIADSGLPIGCEFLDPLVPGYLADLVAWGSVGARTVQSQSHRQFVSGLRRSLMIDASHGDSGKDHRLQPYVVSCLAGRIGSGESGIAGIMLESFVVEGNQKPVPGRAHQLTFGQSVTDACIDWGQTVRLVELLASAVDRRRIERSMLAG